MDPNLQTIIDDNMYNIRQGRLTLPLRQGQDYLINILGEDGYLNTPNKQQMTKEMNEFANKVRSLTPRHKLHTNRKSLVR